MIDLHTHSLLSDGQLCPAELVQRAKKKGYRALAITDHVDSSNLDLIVPQIVKFCRENAHLNSDIRVIPGAELTHLLPPLINKLARKAREKGAKLIIVHGETIVEPVPKGTNTAALDADIDVLAHPGLISEEEVKIAKERGIYLEISSRKGHSLTNGWLARLATKWGTKLILNTDAHGVEDLITEETARKILQGAGLSYREIESVMRNSQELVEKMNL
ncbi:histidinol phosphate phosphatase domain-containing protein [Candidatus Aerophobetes bacterium]|uniref:Histidinol phosphate phosphatase domain-containing protein n=1 Tax=Aerophobetes bacterium TaxID=2030807 RepID=A0A523YP07_UNCAE|nr:MAG: histidinol phosphate phosphatase domain-containing protein [Candidatus Aerophobetes bacterium]